MHFHHCPDCYKKHECELPCTIEPDLEDDGKEFGSHCACEDCDQTKYKTKEFWDRYNGFIK